MNNGDGSPETVTSHNNVCDGDTGTPHDSLIWSDEMKAGNVVGIYAMNGSEKRFDLIYCNFADIPSILAKYRNGIVYMVKCEREYKRQAEKGNLGVRVQTSSGLSNRTQLEALEDISIENSIDGTGLGTANDGLDEDILKDVDDAEEILYQVKEYRLLREEYNLFCGALNNSTGEEYDILQDHLVGKMNSDELADKFCITNEYARKKLSRAKQKLKQYVVPFMKNM